MNKEPKESKVKKVLSDPMLLADWDYDANAPLTPDDFTPYSNKYAFWKCHKCGYKWRATISNRSYGRGCSVCSNKVVVSGLNDLATTHPELAKQWHPTKNGLLQPSSVSYGQGKKVWWICPEGHEYQATILHRSSGTGCPICNSGRQTSFAEQAIFFYVKKLYPDAVSRYRAPFLGRMELDIYIPSIKTAIEYDGIAWHTDDKKNREQRKYNACKSNGIKLIRMKENPEWTPFDDSSDKSFLKDDLYKVKNLEVGISWLLEQIDFSHFSLLNQDINIERDRIAILENYKQIEKLNNFKQMHPDLAKEWHPTKNGSLRPDMFKSKSDKKVWWLCSKCDYSYQATISHRVYGTGCPRCGIEKSASSKSKSVIMFDIEDGSTIREYKSISMAAREMNISAGNISSVCKGIRNQAGGFGWKYS